MDKYPIQVGSMLYTLVDPSKGREVDYNRWYERDHFYAGCMVGPWLFAGRRWVATRRLKDLRFPADSPVAVPADAGSYLAVYWVLEGKHGDHFSWAIDQVQWLYANDRGFLDREHVHTVLFDYEGTVYRDDDPVPVELALDHDYKGLVSVFIDRDDGVDGSSYSEWLADGPLADLLADSPIAMASTWSPIGRDDGVTDQAPMALGSPPGGEERSLQQFFVESDPEECWDAFVDYGKALEADGRAKVALAAPFIPTVVGTDTYTDELW